MSKLQRKIGVRNLNSAGRLETIPAHEHWPLRPLATSRSGALADALPLGREIRSGIETSPFRIPVAVHLYGLRPDDFAGWVARHHHMPQRPTRNSLSPWLSRAGCQIDARRSQREPGLANMGRSRQEPDPQGELNLHPGTIWSMRNKADGAGHANQCTYDAKGILLRTPPGSGTVDWYRSGTQKHYDHDVAPVYLANRLDGGASMGVISSTLTGGPSILGTPGANLNKYFEVRPLWAVEP